MSKVACSDHEFVSQHRKIWAARPELRAVYHNWFKQLLRSVDGLHPIVEIGSGPGFLKECYPHLISTDVVLSRYIDVVSDAGSLPFRPGTIGAFVMVDVLHHLPRPLEFMDQANAALRPGGRLVMIEPWITVPSYILYRFFHHEDCSLKVDLRRPFNDLSKTAFEGNAAIPFKLLKQFNGASPLQLLKADPFLGLPYLATLGFKSTRPIPQWFITMADVCERFLAPVKKIAATRIHLVWEKAPENHNVKALESKPKGQEYRR